MPLFGPIKLDSVRSFLKQALYAFNGMKDTDEVLTFAADLAIALPSKRKLLVMCDAGGTYRPVGVTLEGRRSRSLVALFRILEAGGFESSEVFHVSGGVRGWGEAGLEFEGSAPENWRSRAGMMPPAA